ncbi:hypothetical protein DPMN_078997 [Dreissena polymorpha]|uniref:Uncharacterized protein n=1 Tax=Dreissena polymorpha TaxID=45954 RepID=A0A9D3YRP4_DREPO|nr:hypothetical protein DPMN_078997 [Dreissena polymorpha]
MIFSLMWVYVGSTSHDTVIFWVQAPAVAYQPRSIPVCSCRLTGENRDDAYKFVYAVTLFPSAALVEAGQQHGRVPVNHGLATSPGGAPVKAGSVPAEPRYTTPAEQRFNPGGAPVNAGGVPAALVYTDVKVRDLLTPCKL